MKERISKNLLIGLVIKKISKLNKLQNTNYVTKKKNKLKYLFLLKLKYYT